MFLSEPVDRTRTLSLGWIPVWIPNLLWYAVLRLLRLTEAKYGFDKALRMSMQEEQARQEAAAAVAIEPSTAESSTASPLENAVTPSQTTPVDTSMTTDDDDEEALLAQALALSQGEDVDMTDEADLDEAEAIAKAIRESQSEDGSDGTK